MEYARWWRIVLSAGGKYAVSILRCGSTGVADIFYALGNIELFG